MVMTMSHFWSLDIRIFDFSHRPISPEMADLFCRQLDSIDTSFALKAHTHTHTYMGYSIVSHHPLTSDIGGIHRVPSTLRRILAQSSLTWCQNSIFKLDFYWYDAHVRFQYTMCACVLCLRKMMCLCISHLPTSPPLSHRINKLGGCFLSLFSLSLRSSTISLFCVWK